MSDKEVQQPESIVGEGTDRAVFEDTFEFSRAQFDIQSDKLSLGSLLAKQKKPVFLECEGKRLELPNQATVVLGRSISESTDEQPDIALNDFGAAEKGVSRRHARIARYSNLICITDMGSSNGTFVNGQRLVKNDTRILHNGDDIQLSFLKLKVEF